MTKFFVPHAKDPENPEEFYNEIKNLLLKRQNVVCTDDKIHWIKYVHEGKKYYAEVGKQENRIGGEEVLAIFADETGNLYHICTPTRGLIAGPSVMVGINEKEDLGYFD